MTAGPDRCPDDGCPRCGEATVPLLDRCVYCGVTWAECYDSERDPGEVSE